MIQIQLSEGHVLVVLDYQAVTAKDLPGPVWYHELSCRAFDMPFNFSWERLHTLAITQDFTQYKELCIILSKSGNKESKQYLYRMATDPSVYVEALLRLSVRVTDVIISVFKQSDGKLIPRELEKDRMFRWLHATRGRRAQVRHTSCPGCS